MSYIPTSLRNLIFRSPPSNNVDDQDDTKDNDNNNNNSNNYDSSSAEDDDDDDDTHGAALTQQPQPLPLLDNFTQDGVVGLVDTETAESLNRLLLSDESPRKKPANKDSSNNNKQQQAQPPPPLTTTDTTTTTTDLLASLQQERLPRPGLSELQGDIVEWLCYIIMRQKDAAVVQNDAKVLETFAKQSSFDPIPSDTTTDDDDDDDNDRDNATTQIIPTMEIVWKRLYLTTYYISLCRGWLLDEDGCDINASQQQQQQDDGASNNENEFTVRDWDNLYHQFIVLEKEFRIEPPTPAAAVQPSRYKNSNNSAGTTVRIEKAVYEIIQLLGIQHALAALVSQLNLILNERPRNVRLETRDAMESYHQELERVLFGGGGNINNNFTTIIPNELVFCLPEEAPSSSRGIDRLLLKIKQITSEGPYSQSVLQAKVQAKLIAWEEHYCGTPILVQLGYRGVVPPTSSAAAASAAALTRRSVATATTRTTLKNADDDNILAGDLSSFGAASDSSGSASDDNDDETLETDLGRRRRMRSISGASKFSAVTSSSSNNNNNGGNGDNGYNKNSKGVAVTVGETINPAVVANQIQQVRRSVKQPRRQSMEKQQQQQQQQQQQKTVVPAQKDDDSDSDESELAALHTQPAPIAAQQRSEYNDDDDETGSEPLLPISNQKKTAKAQPVAPTVLLLFSSSADEGEDDLMGTTSKKTNKALSAKRKPESDNRQRHEIDVLLDDASSNNDDDVLLSGIAKRPKLPHLCQGEHDAAGSARLPLQIAIADSSSEDDGLSSGAKGPKFTKPSSGGGGAAAATAAAKKPVDRQLDFSSDEEGDDNRKKNAPWAGRSRKPFTEDEVEAIREGVAKYGAGRWQEIKVRSQGRLAMRSTGQIKDKYRNMCRTNQIEL